MMLIGHDVCDFSLLSKCLCSNEIECSKGAFMCFFFFFFLLAREHTDYEISLYVLKINVWKFIVVKNEWIERKLIMLTVSFFYAFKTKIFLYTCSNRPHEVSIEFLWLYVITVYIYIYICEICLLFLFVDLLLFSLQSVRVPYNVYLFCCVVKITASKHDGLFSIEQHIHFNNDSNHVTNVIFCALTAELWLACLFDRDLEHWLASCLFAVQSASQPPVLQLNISLMWWLCWLTFHWLN